MTQLTEHFTLEEMIFSQTASREGIDNTPGDAEKDCLTQLCTMLEKVRDILGGHPIYVSSGYRCPELNAACGGSSSSAHMHGLACDFTCPAFGTPKEICLAIEPHMADLMIDQLIYEYGDWVHIGMCAGVPRCMCLTINTMGTFNGIA